MKRIHPSIADMAAVPTLGDFYLSRAEAESPLWRRFHEHLGNELERLRRQNDSAEKIEPTTIRRGEIALAKRILALSPEVGPESSESEGDAPESQPAGFIAGIPVTSTP